MDCYDPLTKYLRGKGGLETAAWAAATGLDGFDTLYAACEKALRAADFNWHENAPQVDLGGEHIVTKPWDEIYRGNVLM